MLQEINALSESTLIEAEKEIGVDSSNEGFRDALDGVCRRYLHSESDVHVPRREILKYLDDIINSVTILRGFRDDAGPNDKAESITGQIQFLMKIGGWKDFGDDFEERLEDFRDRALKIRQSFPGECGGRPDNRDFNLLILQLIQIAETATGRKITVLWRNRSGEYDGPIFRYLWAIVSELKLQRPGAPHSREALGNLVRDINGWRKELEHFQNESPYPAALK